MADLIRILATGSAGMIGQLVLFDIKTMRENLDVTKDTMSKEKFVMEH